MEREILASGRSQSSQGGIVQLLENSRIVERTGNAIAKARQRADYKAMLASVQVRGGQSGSSFGPTGVSNDPPVPGRDANDSDSGSDFDMDVDTEPIVNSVVENMSGGGERGSSSGSDFDYGGLAELQGRRSEASFEGPQSISRVHLEENSGEQVFLAENSSENLEGTRSILGGGIDSLSQVSKSLFDHLRSDLLGLDRELLAAQLSADPESVVREHFESFTAKYPVERWKPKLAPVRVIPTGAKRRRRFLYRQIQRSYTKRRSECCREVVTGDWEKGNQSAALELADVEPFWREIFEAESVPDPRTPEPIREEVLAVVAPISIDEVKTAIKQCSSKTAPGVDGFRLQHLRAVPAAELAAVYNLWLLAGRLPAALDEARTTLIPKERGTVDPAKFRPITVTSILTRLFHRILASRIERCCPINQRQKAFRKIDGMSENVLLLRFLLAKATDARRPRPLYLCFLDVRKAFDSVSFESLFLALRRVGVPEHLISYFRNVYNARFTRVYSGANKSAPIRPKKGVSQGDPTSGILFNMLIDWVLTELDPTIGFPLADSLTELNDLLTYLAFADDLALAAQSVFDLRRQVDLCVEALRKCGLEVNASKCRVLAIKVDGHTRQWACDESAEVFIGGNRVPTTKMSDLLAESRYKYLGIQFGVRGTFLNVENRLVSEIDQTRRAPLRPEQRMFILRQNILPALNHQLVLARCSMSALRKLDRRIRVTVRTWLRLPHDTPLAYFYANPKDGGLGLRCLAYGVPALKRKRLATLTASEDPLVQIMVASSWFTKLTNKWSSPVVMTVTPLDNNGEGGDTLPFTMNLSKAESDYGWQTALYRGCWDGFGLRETAGSWKTQRWVTSGGGLITGKRFIGAIALRGGLLPCKARSTRGRQRANLPKHCDCCGPGWQETLQHILQVCPRTHDPRSKRHNEICKLLVHQLRRKGWEVVVEPRIPYSGTWAKPDIIAARLDPESGVKAFCLDVTVCSDQYGAANSAHLGKIAKYSEIGGGVPVVSNWVRSWAAETFGPTYGCEPRYTACAISWRGIFSRLSYESLSKELKLSAADLTLLTVRTLEWGAWTHRFFSRSTARVRRRIRR